MSKILAISDLHIHDYPQRNPTNKYRLYQTRTVASNIIEVAESEGADILVIAGDTVDNFLNRPYVQAEVKNFLDTVMAHFKMGFIIWGNHDQDNKGVNSEFTDCALSVMLPKNLYYADMKEINVDGKRIGFYNWRPEFDLSWVNGQLDILFTHATISYSREDNFHSQVLDESKFKLAICGDIHKPANSGKYMSIGIPQRCRMSDSEYCTGVVVDCVESKCYWVNLNPHDNLIKFQYTEQRDLEGWSELDKTWYVYKPSNHVVNSGVRNINIPAWEEIGHLIENVLVREKLENIHSEVIKTIPNLDANEVDFNFTITRFYCKNWRSIEEAELYLGAGDRILLTGHNGSGKSSLLSAIKYAFVENPHYKDFVQFGAKECITEVDFIYQGVNYRIQRGSKKYGFWIEGEPQKYNKKAEFEKDMHIRFPFIDFMDVCFFDSDHPRFIGDITPERKSEIISRFFKMDRIDTYNDHAKVLLEQLVRGSSKWLEGIDKSKEVLRFIETKLQGIVLPQESLDSLIVKRDYGRSLQKKLIAYNDFIERSASLMARKENDTFRLAELKQKLDSFRDFPTIDSEIERLKKQQSWVEAEYMKFYSLNVEKDKLIREKDQLMAGAICPTCGQPIKKNPGSHIQEFEQRIFSVDRAIQEQNQVLLGWDDKAKAELNNSIARLYTEKQNNTLTSIEYDKVRQDLKKVEEDLSNLGNIPEKPELPEGFIEQLGFIEAEIGTWNQYNTLVLDKSKEEEKIKAYESEIEKTSSLMEDFQRYIKLTGPTGDIYEEIMKRLAGEFSDNRVTYKTNHFTFRGKEHLSLDSFYNLRGNEVPYINCSDGQRTILDVDFLQKIVTGMGFLIMDEFLKHLDSENHDIVLDLIKEMKVDCVILCSHMDSVPSFNNKSIQLTLNDSAITNVLVK